MTALYLKMMNAFDEAVDKRRESGQGTVEYVGIAVVVAVLIGAIVAVLGDDTAIGNAISRVVRQAIDAIGGEL